MAASKYYGLSIRNLAYRLRKFDEVLGRELVKTVLAHEQEIIEAITEDQLYERGVNGDDVEIMTYAPYAPSTVKRKIRKGQPYNRVTLRDTGEWYKSLRLIYDVDGFYLTSTDYKNKYLKDKYGPKILKLTKENLKMFSEMKIQQIWSIEAHKESIKHIHYISKVIFIIIFFIAWIKNTCFITFIFSIYRIIFLTITLI